MAVLLNLKLKNNHLQFVTAAGASDFAAPAAGKIHMSLIIIFTAFLASILTFFSGFGLGTILTPVFAVWFPIDLAVALTAIVHLLNNLFKLLLVGKYADRKTVVRFGVPAVLAAFFGAWILIQISHFQPIMSYLLFGREFFIHPLKLTIALLIIFFTLFEAIPKFKNWTVDQKYIPVGGFLSGFFGGLSGHQGALRSAFLVRIGLSKEGFVATGIVIACMVDFVRLGVYWEHFAREGMVQNVDVLGTATIAAFAGAYVGSRLLKKMTMSVVQTVVSGALLVLAVALGLGLI